MNSVLCLLGLILANSVFLKANTQEDCFDAAGLITIGKYLDFRNAVASSDEEARQPDADLMREASQLERDAPMLGLSQEEVMQYCDWAEHGDEKYDLIFNEDGSFSLVENGNENETSSPLMMFGWGKKPAGDNRVNQARTGNDRETDLPMVGANVGDNQPRGFVAPGQPMARENQGNNQLAVEPVVTLDNFINAALSHFNDNQLIVRRPNQSRNPVFAMGSWEHNSISELRNSRRKETKIELEKALKKAYGEKLVENLPLIKRELWSSPLRSLDIFKIVMEMEKRATTDILGRANVDQDEWSRVSIRKKNFRNSAIEFAQRVGGMPPSISLSNEITNVLTMMARNSTGSTSVTAALGVGLTLDNHDSFTVPAAIMSYINTREQQLAYQIAAHVCFDYEKKFLRSRPEIDNEEGEPAVPATEASVTLSPLPIPEPQAPAILPSLSALRGDDVTMESNISRAITELKSLWRRSEKRYGKFQDLFKRDWLWRTHYLEKVNQSVPWYSYNKGSLNPARALGATEFDLVKRIYESSNNNVPESVRNVIRKTYSLRHNVHEIIMNRGFVSSGRQIHVAQANRSLDEIKEAVSGYDQWEGPNATAWRAILQTAKQAAERANDLIQQIHSFKTQGYIF